MRRSLSRPVPRSLIRGGQRQLAAAAVGGAAALFCLAQPIHTVCNTPYDCLSGPPIRNAFWSV